MINKGRLPMRKLGSFRIDDLRNFDRLPQCQQLFRRV